MLNKSLLSAYKTPFKYPQITMPQNKCCSSPILQSPKYDMFISFSGITRLPCRNPIKSLIGDFSHKIKILFPDIDGTMRDADGTIINRARKALDNFKKNNIPVILSTGRTYTEAYDMFKNLGIRSDYIITQQGAEVVDLKGNVIYQSKLNHDIAKKVINSYYEYKTKVHGANTKMVVYVDKLPYSEEEVHLPLNWEKINHIDSYMSLLKDGKAPTKILFYESGDIDPLIPFMKNRLPEDIRVGITAKGYCEITNQDATKGNAAKIVLKHLGIDPRNAAAIGDADNDIPMLQAVRDGNGLSIAMGNALETVKDVAEYETEKVSNDGFAIALESILENNNQLSKIKQR